MSEISELKKKYEKRIRDTIMPKVKEGIRVTFLNQEFKEYNDEDIPFKKLGYSSLLSMLEKMPKAVRLARDLENPRELRVFPVADESSKHIEKLVRQQNNSKKKKTSYRGRMFSSLSYGHRNNQHFNSRTNPYISNHYNRNYYSSFNYNASNYSNYSAKCNYNVSNYSRTARGSAPPAPVSKNPSTTNLPESSSWQIYGDRLKSLLATFKYGLDSKRVQKLYLDKYRERLPTIWLKTLQEKLSQSFEVERITADFHTVKLKSYSTATTKPSSSVIQQSSIPSKPSSTVTKQSSISSRPTTSVQFSSDRGNEQGLERSTPVTVSCSSQASKDNLVDLGSSKDIQTEEQTEKKSQNSRGRVCFQKSSESKTVESNKSTAMSHSLINDSVGLPVYDEYSSSWESCSSYSSDEEDDEKTSNIRLQDLSRNDESNFTESSPESEPIRPSNNSLLQNGWPVAAVNFDTGNWREYREIESSDDEIDSDLEFCVSVGDYLRGRESAAEDCPCWREETLVYCYNCNSAHAGRVLLDCPEHPGVQRKTDYKECPDCHCHNIIDMEPCHN